MTYYKNLNLHSVNYGFGWRYDGDMSTHPIGNILEDLDYKVYNLNLEYNKLKKQNEILKKVVDFYARGGKYSTVVFEEITEEYAEAIDNGELARKALKKIEKNNGESCMSDTNEILMNMHNLLSNELSKIVDENKKLKKQNKMLKEILSLVVNNYYGDMYKEAAKKALKECEELDR